MDRSLCSGEGEVESEEESLRVVEELPLRRVAWDMAAAGQYKKKTRMG